MACWVIVYLRSWAHLNKSGRSFGRNYSTFTWSVCGHVPPKPRHASRELSLFWRASGQPNRPQTRVFCDKWTASMAPFGVRTRRCDPFCMNPTFAKQKTRYVYRVCIASASRNDHLKHMAVGYTGKYVVGDWQAHIFNFRGSNRYIRVGQTDIQIYKYWKMANYFPLSAMKWLCSDVSAQSVSSSRV